MTTATPRFGRPLSPSERWFWIIDRLSPAHCVGRVRVGGPVAAERVAAAADALLAEYPLLRMGVVDRAGRDPWLRPEAASSIPVRRMVTGDGEAWVGAIDAELRTPFDLRKGLVRVVDIAVGVGTDGEFHDIVLTVSHIIVDGRSLMTLLRKLVLHVGGHGAAPVERDSTAPADVVIPAAARGFWRYAYTNLFDQVAALRARPVRLTGTPVELSDRRTRVVHRVVDREALADLVSDCRRAGVTVHGMLAAAVAGAIGRAADPGVAGFAGIGSPVDFRSLLEPAPEPDDLGIYAPVLVGFVPFGPELSVWKAARSVKRQLDRGVRERRHLSTVAGMRFGTPKDARAGRRLAGMVDRRAPWNVSVTNIGRVDFPGRVGAHRISDLTLAASNSCVSVMTVAVATAHDEMRLAFCYVEQVVTARRAEAFADAVVSALLARPEPSADPALQQGA
ncbi:phthiocerol/phthiodiolone dimycocerosyl transferase family protein [Nocardia sp. CDC160]|uniref:phthiocerol/phthiodiolone dimycocerosyl transferase family protein n=1 Tax=Nocardia sp. CDC160 TaxID=3112166 RepID=UPI002DC0148C|nr:hypothetical protein [Nocardia sp. CDC160]MEC3919624.1 hypothetical protein [Nocardia sp. CDC160]